MSSEVIVVVVLIVIAVGFIIWVRKHSQDHEPNEQVVGAATKLKTGSDQE